MLVENQLVEVRWNVKNRERYEKLGYPFTKFNDVFTIKAEDLNHTNSTVPIYVMCDYCGEVYQTTYWNYLKGIKIINKSCCNNQDCKNKKSSEVQVFKNRDKQYKKFVDLCNKRGYVPISTAGDYKNSQSKLKYMCPKHGIKESNLPNFEKNAVGCIECSWDINADNKRRRKEDITSYVESKNNDKLLNPDEYINSSTSNLQILCGSCNRIFVTSYSAFKLSSGKCRGCATHERCKMDINDVINKVRLHNNSVLLNPEDYYNVNTKNLKIRCGLCGTEYLSTLSNIKHSGNTCPNCSNKICVKLKPEEVSLRINSINNNQLLNPEAYTGVYDKNLKIKCGSCGDIFITSLGLLELSPTGKCKKCSPISSGEEIIAEVLDKYNIVYTRQEDFDGDCRDIRPLLFDFYIPDYNLCCEFDGMHHMEPIYGEEQFIKTKLHDAMKNWYCRWNNIGLLRIPYWERNNIERILIDTLNLSPHIEKQPIKIKYISNRKSA